MTTREKQLILTINHNNNTTAVMLMREFLGPDNQWWPMQPIDASQDAAAIDAFSKSLIGSQQAQITQLATERDSLQTELTAKVNDNTAKRSQIDSLTEQIATTQEQLDAANALITELEAQLNPPNPFPNADWASFKFAILADEAIQRVATENATAWPLMVLYLSQLDTNPSRGVDIAQLWNFMEAHAAVDDVEIARINAISQQFNIPLQMNSGGQIVLP